MELSELRESIDEIDSRLIELFRQRMALSAQVAQYKKAHDLPIFVPGREQEILNKRALQAGPELAPYAKELYETIFSLSRRYQEAR